MAEREPALVTPFWVRIATETNLSPGWLLVAFPAVLYPTYLLLEVLFGRGLAAATDFAGDYDARLLPAASVGLGYLSLMTTYVARGTFIDLEALRPILCGGETAYAELRKQLVGFSRRRLWFGGLFGFLCGIAVAELAVGRWTRLFSGDWLLRDPCVLAVAFALWIVGGRIVVYLIDSAKLYSRLGERHVTVDLLDLHRLAPLTRHALRIVLFCVIGIGIVAFFAVLDYPSSHSMKALPVTFVTCFLNGILAAAVFVLPVRGLRRQIRARKAEELGRVREEIRLDRELAAQRGPESAEASARLPGLLAYMNQIDSVREWPFDAPTLTRFFLYVAIPLGSWVGGALVERLLGAALD